jgi:hypothetical protein
MSRAECPACGEVFTSDFRGQIGGRIVGNERAGAVHVIE